MPDRPCVVCRNLAGSFPWLPSGCRIESLRKLCSLKASRRNPDNSYSSEKTQPGQKSGEYNGEQVRICPTPEKTVNSPRLANAWVFLPENAASFSNGILECLSCPAPVDWL